MVGDTLSALFPSIGSIAADDWRLVTSAAILAAAEQSELPPGRTPILEPLTWRRWLDGLRWQSIRALNRQVWADSTLRQTEGGADPKGLGIGLWVLQQLNVPKNDDRIEFALNVGSRIRHVGQLLPALAREGSRSEQDILERIARMSAYQLQTMTCLRTILGGLDEALLHRVLRNKPHLGEVIASRLEEDETPEATALAIASALLTELIEATDPKLRAEVQRELVARAASLQDQDAVPLSPHSGSSFALLRALVVADDWREAKVITDQECDYLTSEITGALTTDSWAFYTVLYSLLAISRPSRNTARGFGAGGAAELLHGLIERADGTAELRFGLASLTGYIWVRYRTGQAAGPAWPYRRLDRGFDHLAHSLRELAHKFEFVGSQYARSSDEYLSSLDSLQGLRGYREMQTALDLIIVYLRIVPDLVADLMSYFYGHPGPSHSSFRGHREWFLNKRPNVDPAYTAILRSHSAWFDDLARKEGAGSEKGLRDLLIHRFGSFQFPVVVGQSWEDEQVTADMVSKAGYHEGVHSILKNATTGLFAYLDMLTAHLNVRVHNGTGWAPLSRLDGAGCTVMNYPSVPPSRWLLPTSAL